MMKVNFNPINPYIKQNVPSPVHFKGKDEEDKFIKSSSNDVVDEFKYVLYDKIFANMLNNFLLCSLDTLKKTPSVNISIDSIKDKDTDNYLLKYMCYRFQIAGITTFKDVKNFATLISKLGKETDDYKEKYIDVYGALENKEDLVNFPNLTLVCQLINETEDKRINPNYVTEDIKRTGVQNEKKFFSTFENYAQEYNNFETPFDKLNACACILATYDEKYEAFKEITDPNGAVQDKKNRALYLKLHNIIDYLYANEPNKWKEKFSKVYKIALEENRLGENARTKLNNYFDFKDVKNKIQLYEFLNKNNANMVDLNSFVKDTAIESAPTKELIENKEDIINEIVQCGIDPKAATSILYNLKDVIYACYQNQEDFSSSDGIKSCLNLIENFNVKNDKDFVKLYETITKQKLRHNQKISNQEVISFVDTLNYANEDIKSQFRKFKNYNILKKSEERKAEFEKLNEQYKTFSLANGKSALDIFNETNDIKATETIIEKAYFDISKEEEEAFEALKNYFNTPYEAEHFLKTQINRSGIKDYKTFSNNCIKILDALDKTENKEYISKLQEENVLQNSSKQCINSIVQKLKDPNILSQFFITSIDREIAPEELLALLKKYQDDSGNYENVLLSYSNCPNIINHNLFQHCIDTIQQGFDKRNIVIKINNENIANFRPSFINLHNKNLTDRTIGIYADAFGKTRKDENFICNLNSAYVKTPPQIAKWQIASEIGNYIYDDKNSYKNIVKLLQLEDIQQKADQDQKQVIQEISNHIPQEFVDLVNSKKVQTFHGKTINTSLHSKLRAIERYLVNENSTMEEVCSKTSVQKLKNIFKTIYTDTPNKIINEDKTKKSFSCIYDDKESPTGRTKAIFEENGKLITIVPTDL